MLTNITYERWNTKKIKEKIAKSEVACPKR